MQKYQDVVLRPSGSVVSGASVLVKTYPGGVTATIYSDNGVTAATNPLTTDAYGRFSFYAADGHYQIVVSGTGIATQTVSDVLLEDASAYRLTPMGSTDCTAQLAAALVVVAAQTQRPKIIFQAGTYTYSVSPNWGVQNLCLEAEGEVRLVYTGTGNCVIFDAGASDSATNVSFTGNFIIQGGAASQNGIYMRSVHHSKIEARVFGCGTTYAALRTEFAVCNDYGVVASVNEEGWYSRPAYGYWLGRRGAGENTAACIFRNPIIEAVATACMVLEYAHKCTFEAGTAEGSLGLGLDIRVTSEYNSFNGIDMEANTSSDIQDAGLYNEYRGILSTGAIEITAAAGGTKFFGGTLNAIADSGLGTVFMNCSYSNAGGALTGTENKRIKIGMYNQTGAAFDADQLPGALTVHKATAIPAGGTTGSGLKFSTTANFGVFFGSGVPTLSAAKGSLYLRSDGSSTSTRMYVNTDGATAWTAVTTAT